MIHTDEDDEFDRIERENKFRGQPYVYEPKREWIGLDQQERKLFSSWLDHKTDEEVFTAIEDKLKEKNS